MEVGQYRASDVSVDVVGAIVYIDYVQGDKVKVGADGVTLTVAQNGETIKITAASRDVITVGRVGPGAAVAIGRGARATNGQVSAGGPAIVTLEVPRGTTVKTSARVKRVNDLR